jgi:hypothetical protein
MPDLVRLQAATPYHRSIGMILTDGVHLISDYSVDELHRFAVSIGLKRKWFQDHRIPHYDIKGQMVEAVRRRGICFITTRELILAYRNGVKI